MNPSTRKNNANITQNLEDTITLRSKRKLSTTYVTPKRRRTSSQKENTISGGCSPSDKEETSGLKIRSSMRIRNALKDISNASVISLKLTTRSCSVEPSVVESFSKRKVKSSANRQKNDSGRADMDSPNQGHCSFRCGICSKEFGKKWLLERHENVHTGVKPYECKHCGKNFSTSGNVASHISYTHINAKPWQCDRCPQNFPEWRRLQQHLIRHGVAHPIRKSYINSNMKFKRRSLQDNYIKSVGIQTPPSQEKSKKKPVKIDDNSEVYKPEQKEPVEVEEQHDQKQSLVPVISNELDNTLTKQEEEKNVVRQEDDVMETEVSFEQQAIDEIPDDVHVIESSNTEHNAVIEECHETVDGERNCSTSEPTAQVNEMADDVHNDDNFDLPEPAEYLGDVSHDIVEDDNDESQDIVGDDNDESQDIVVDDNDESQDIVVDGNDEPQDIVVDDNDESQDIVEDDNVSLASGPVYRERYIDDLGSELSDDSLSDLDDFTQVTIDSRTTETIPRKRAASLPPGIGYASAPQLCNFIEAIPTSRKVQCIEGTSQYIIETFAKKNVDKLYLVWHEEFNLDIARSVAGNSKNTILFVKKFNEQHFPLLNKFPSNFVKHQRVYIGEDLLQEVHCFTFGENLMSSHCGSYLFPNFERLERELVRFANCHSKTLVHIIDQDWESGLVEELKEEAIVSMFTI